MLELRRKAWMLGLVAFIALSACPDHKQSQDKPKGPTKGCTKAYEKCELGTGVLGICDVVDCAPGTPEPCLQCRSQH